ncbi:SUKH-4 family immunity protein [Streptomyces sp. NPDC052773]|uniref:SUKH-4 family immunity protein n=1 Tax=Streptomyces sp. NPDC052773 TaxID=3365693 RepID=UPI0037CD28C9
MEVSDWDIPHDCKLVLRLEGIPAMVGLWITARIQRGSDPKLHFPELDPLYEVCRVVSRWNPDTAYACFGVERGTGRVFRAHPVTPTVQVDPATEFHPARLVNSSVRQFVDCLQLVGAEYMELFGAVSARDVSEDSPGDDESMWAVYSKYLPLFRAADSEAFEQPESYWRHLYWMTWQEFGFRPLADGSQPFDSSGVS